MLAVEERGKFVDPLTFSFRKRGMTLMYLSLRPPSRSPGGQGINIDLDTMVKPWYDRREKKCHGMTEGRKRQRVFEFFIIM